MRHSYLAGLCLAVCALALCALLHAPPLLTLAIAISIVPILAWLAVSRLSRAIVSVITGVLLAVLLCACGTVSNAVPSSAQLTIGQDLAAATAGLDAAVNAAELAHKSGVLVGANWSLAKQAIAKAQGVVDVADTAYSAGDFATVSSSLTALPALVATIQQPTGAALGDGLVTPAAP